MENPARYEALLNNVFRLLEDAELLLDAGRYGSAKALAIYAIEEAGKHSSLVGNMPPLPKAKLHMHRQQVMGDYFESAAIFEAFAREIDGLLDHLKATSPESYAEAAAMSRPELIRFTIHTMRQDEAFDLGKFIRKVVGQDLSLRFAEESKTGEFHKQRQQSIHTDYDANGRLLGDPCATTEEDAKEYVELARFAATLQTLWQDSWNREHLS